MHFFLNGRSLWFIERGLVELRDRGLVRHDDVDEVV
jgi:hypothetical protein